MKRVIGLAAVALSCSTVIGIVAPGLLIEGAASSIRGVSDMIDDVLFIPVICTVFVVGPIAAGVSACFISRALLKRMGPPDSVLERREIAQARATGVLTTILSWVLFVVWSAHPVWFW